MVPLKIELNLISDQTKPAAPKPISGLILKVVWTGPDTVLHAGEGIMRGVQLDSSENIWEFHFMFNRAAAVRQLVKLLCQISGKIEGSMTIIIEYLVKHIPVAAHYVLY